MSKNIVLCMDGTGDEIGAFNTNIAKIFQALQVHENQIVYYDPGVATGKILKPIKLFQFVTGAGISKNIMKAYEYLSHHYEAGDRVYLFGFSRGAYAARSLMGLIRCVGLLQPNHISHLRQAYRLYAGEASVESKTKFREKYSRSCEIYFIGVFDTVGSLLGDLFFKGFGLFVASVIAIVFQDYGFVLVAMFAAILFLLTPWVGKLNAFLGIHKFHNTMLTSLNTYSFHAVSIDEKRRSFKPSLWKNTQSERVQQLWFAGTHKDIGGPSVTRETSNTALQWMMSHARLNGVDFNFDERNLKINNNGALTPNRFPLNLFPVARRLKSDYKFHASVKQRIEMNPKYRSAKKIEKLNPIFVENPE